MTRAKLIDAHTHLQNSGAVPALHDASNLAAAVVCATSEADWKAVSALARAHPRQIWPQLGVHPWWAGGIASDEEAAATIERLRSSLLADLSAGVGEIGLDRCKRGLAASPFEAQVRMFNRQLLLATQLQRPVSVHCVQAHTQMLELLKAHVDEHRMLPPGLLMHSYGGNLQQAQALLALAGSCAAADSSHSATSTNPHVLFSFVGSIVTAMANEYVQWLHRKLRGSGVTAHPPAVAAAPAPAAAVSGGGEAATTASPQLPELPRGAGTACMKALATLPVEHLVFETDSPDQPFAHTLHTRVQLPSQPVADAAHAFATLPLTYFEWEASVFGALPAVGEERDAAAAPCAAPCPGCCSTEAATACTATGANTAAAEPAPADKPPPRNSPLLLPHVIRAAAVWRVLHGHAAPATTAATAAAPVLPASGGAGTDAGVGKSVKAKRTGTASSSSGGAQKAASLLPAAAVDEVWSAACDPAGSTAQRMRDMEQYLTASSAHNTRNMFELQGTG